MAAASPVGPKGLTQVELIGKLFLNLWKRMDQLDGENSWSEVARIDPEELDQYISAIWDMLVRTPTNARLHAETEAIYWEARHFIDARQVTPRSAALKVHLRDEAFRFLDQAAKAR